MYILYYIPLICCRSHGIFVILPHLSSSQTENKVR